MIKRKEEYRRTVIDLDGADGNVFVLLSLAKSFCQKLDWDYDKFDAEVKFFSHSYEDVVALFDSWFSLCLEPFKNEIQSYQLIYWLLIIWVTNV